MSQAAGRMAATSRIGCAPNRNSCGTTRNGEVPTDIHDALNDVAQTKGSFMTFTKLILVLACLMSGTLVAQEAKVTELMSKDLTSFPGKEGLMITVEYPPGSKDPIHRHNAYGFIYVLEGSIVMQVRGGKEVTLTPGQTFYEGPDDVHVIGRNASQTKPAKFVVFFVKDKGAPLFVAAK
jgi:quercetin dioxygenase-like cupin family protein